MFVVLMSYINERMLVNLLQNVFYSSIFKYDVVW